MVHDWFTFRFIIGSQMVHINSWFRNEQLDHSGTYKKINGS